MQIRVIERAQQIQVQDQEIVRREKELDATIQKPAEAEKYRLEKLAEANRLVLRATLPSKNKIVIFTKLKLSRYRNPQLKVGEITHYLFNLRPNVVSN